MSSVAPEENNFDNINLLLKEHGASDEDVKWFHSLVNERDVIQKKLIRQRFDQQTIIEIVNRIHSKG